MARNLFISYAAEDAPTVRTMERYLARRGWSVWLDQHRLSPGAQWGREVSTAIARSHVVLAVISPATLRSQWVDAELQLAVDHDRPVLAVVIEQTDPQAIRDHLGLYLGRHWIDYGAVEATLDGSRLEEVDAALERLAAGATARVPGSTRKAVGTVLATVGVIGLVVSFGAVMVMMAGAFGDFGGFVDALLESGPGEGSADVVATFRGYVGSLIEIAAVFVAVFVSMVVTMVGFVMRRSARRQAFNPRRG